jgi:hypothetical protein
LFVCFGRCLRFHPLFAVFLEHGLRRNEGKACHETVKSEGGGGDFGKEVLTPFCGIKLLEACEENLALFQL